MDFGRYELLGERARGACGIVYEARDRELDRTVALKVLRPDDAGPVSRERFLREARLAASLDHPNVVRILETGEHEGRPFYTMPLLEGEPLRGPLPPGEACRILERVADAAAHAHARGVVHRDLKPSNILVCAGEPILTDFGVARGPSGDRLTETGELLGTPAYMAPEQARGESREADGRADVYSIGVLLHEMLTGRLPHVGDSFLELTTKILYDPAPELRGFDPELAAVVRRCLAKRPAARPDAAELARALGRWSARPRPRWGPAMSILPLAAALALWGGLPGAAEPRAADMLRIGDAWIDRDEAPARPGGYSYLEALASCLRAGKRLPTEEEWEAGVRAGCRDMADHLAEWTATEGRGGPDTRVVRGGHGLSPAERRTVRERQELPVTRRAPTLGFRCATSVPPADDLRPVPDQEVPRMRHRGTGDMFRQGVLNRDSRRQVDPRVVEDGADEGRAEGRVLLAAPVHRLPHHGPVRLQDAVQIVAGPLGHKVQAGHEDAADVLLLEPEVQHAEVGPLVLAGVLLDPVFLDAVAELAPAHFEVALDQPGLAVEARPLEDGDVRPQTGLRLVVHSPLADADRAVDRRTSAEEAHAAGLRVALEKLEVGQAADAPDLRLAHPFTGSRIPSGPERPPRK